MAALHELTMTQARALMLSGELTSAAYLTACLDRIAERDGQVGAWAHLERDAAISSAREADALRAKAIEDGVEPLSEELYLLAGMPVGVKDIIDTADMPTECGTAAMAGRQPEVSADAVTELRLAGAIIPGKTVTTELALFTPRGTCNPVDLAHSAGGSSSGSAAAVADFHVPVALATQTAGSILRPASYCGVIGYKPTFGTISQRGTLCQSAPLDTVGIIARSVNDLVLVDAAIGAAGLANLYDFAAAGQLGRPRPRLKRLRLPVDQEADPAALAALDAFVAQFADCRETRLEQPFEEYPTWQRDLQFAGAATHFAALFAASDAEPSAKLAEVMAYGETVTLAAYIKAELMQEAIAEHLADCLDPADVLVTLAAPSSAPRDLTTTGSPAMNLLATYAGMPAISLPLLEVNGMPLGVQLIAPRGQDAQLFNAAQWLMDNCTRFTGRKP